MHDLSSPRPDGNLNSDGRVLLVSQSGPLHRGWHRSGRSHHRQSSALVLAFAFAVVALLSIPVGSAMALAPVVTYHFTAGADGWGGTGATPTSAPGGTGVCFGGSGGCVASTSTAISPSIAVTAGDYFYYTYEQFASGTAWTPQVVNGTATTLSASCGAADANGWKLCQTSNWHIPSGVTSVVVQLTTSGGTAYLDEVSAYDVSPGVVTYPSLDLPTISTQMNNFFSFLAPLLYVVGGIGLGGLIIAKARHLF